MDDKGDDWNVQTVADQVNAVLSQLGFGSPGLALLRHGENMTFRVVDHPLVVRVARPYAEAEAVETEVRCAEFLESRRFPASRLFQDVKQPIPTSAGLLTLWRCIDGRVGDDDDLPLLGELLARLHKLDRPAWLRGWDPLRKVPARLREIARQDVLPRNDLDFLYSSYETLDAEVGAVISSSAANSTLCHGDAHTGNMLVTETGAFLVDWEDCSVGPAEWDLGETLMTLRRFGLSDNLYQRFVAAYGVDARESPLADLSARVRELTATSWLLQNGAASAHVLAEGRLRIHTLRDPSDQSIWSAF